MTTPNRQYKDSLFTDYFNDKERIIEAYNAIAGTDFPPTANVEFKTLENILYRSQINDIAFTIEGKFIVLIEYQSTVNANMPIRLLMYINEIFKSIVPQKPLYGSKALQIPTPEFVVFYNGKREHPDKKILKLSDSYMVPTAAPSLELVVPVYNINKGHNTELLEQCKALSDYTMFVSLVNDRVENGDALEDAIDKAIHYCLENSIMHMYLERGSAEVKRMLITEWNDDEYREVMREEGREEGLEQGREEGLEEGREEGLEQGREEGAVRAKQEVARRMKDEGAEISFIAKVTGLSEAEIVEI